MNYDIINISESMELPITEGKINVDTSKGSITIFMKPGPVHTDNDELIITKVSEDNNIVSLFSESVLINKADIVIFGLRNNSNVKGGNVNTIALRCDGNNWKILYEK